MDPRIRLVLVAITSLAAGFMINEQFTDEGRPVSPGDQILVGVEPNASTVNAVPETTTQPSPSPRPVPLPVIEPSVRFELAPAGVAAADHAVVGDADDVEFVAMLNHEGADVEDGFETLEPGSLTRMTWRAGESLYGSSIPTPVLVAQGGRAGPTLCLTGAVHGDELNGIETVRRLMYSLNPQKLRGRVIGVPIVNLQGFERHSRYLPDRRDLNRFFPGNPTGSSASRIAHSFFENIIRHCDALVDLHTGSFHRTNLPQLRANLLDESVIELTEGFGGLVILHSTGGEGTLRASAVAASIPAVTLEAGEPLRVDDKAVDHSVKALFTLMDNLSMVRRRSLWGNPEPTYYSSMWVRADKGGMLLGEVKLGKRVSQGDVLGTVTDPITNAKQDIRAPRDGRVIGMALNQFVMPGYAAFHLGVEASPDALPRSPTADDVDHAVAAAGGMIDERDESDE